MILTHMHTLVSFREIAPKRFCAYKCMGDKLYHVTGCQIHMTVM